MASAWTYARNLAELFLKRNRQKPAAGASRKILEGLGGIWCPPWETAMNFFRRLGERLSVVSEDQVRAAAEEYKKLVLDTLEQQRYKDRWPPLSARYLAWKKRHKRDLRMLISTKEYMKSIEVRREEGSASEGEKTIFFIVGLPDRLHQEAKIPIRKLARIHEFGAKTVTKDGREVYIPPRPLWRPTQEEFKQKHAAKVLERIQVEVLKEIKTLFEDFKKAQSDYRRGLNP